MGKITLSGWDTQSTKTLYNVERKLPREKPGVGFHSYNKGDVDRFLCFLILSLRCQPLRYYELQKSTGTSQISSDWFSECWLPACPLLTGHCQPQGSQTESDRPAPCLLPGKEVYSESVRSCSKWNTQGSSMPQSGLGGEWKSTVMWVVREGHFKKLIFELNKKRWEEGLALWNTKDVPGRESHGPEAREILWHLNI